MGRVAQFGVYVEILGTFGVAVVLGIHGFHHGLGFLTSTLVMAVVTVAGIIVYFAVHGGREIGAYIVDTDAPGTEAESVASET